MSTFGSSLKKYITNSGCTIYSLAKSTGIERTGIHRAISGQRPLSPDSLQKILEHLQLDPSEKKDLIMAYELEHLGRSRFEQKNLICSLIESLYLVVQRKTFSFSIEKDIHFSIDTQESPFIHGKFYVIQLVRALLESECYQADPPIIRLFSCPDKDFISQILPSFHSGKEKSKAKPVLQQLVRLYKTTENEDNVCKNLEILHTLLPFCLANGLEYQIYYQYHDPASFLHNGVVFPYYVILKQCVVLLSADLQTALIQTGEAQICYYQLQFDEAILESRKLLSIYHDPKQLLTHHITVQNAEERVSYLEYQPCFITFADKKMVEENLNSELENKEQILEMAMKRIGCLTPSTPNHTMFWAFTAEGLEHFMETGIFTDFPPGLSNVLPFDTRLELLCRMREGCKSDYFEFHFLNTDLFHLPPNVTIAAREFQGLEFFLYDPKRGSCSLIINELTLSRAFFDFITNMPASSLVFSKEKTLEMFDFYIGHYSKMKRSANP